MNVIGQVTVDKVEIDSQEIERDDQKVMIEVIVITGKSSHNDNICFIYNNL